MKQVDQLSDVFASISSEDMKGYCGTLAPLEVLGALEGYVLKEWVGDGHMF
jgi:hypothetical protein